MIEEEVKALAVLAYPSLSLEEGFQEGDPATVNWHLTGNWFEINVCVDLYLPRVSFSVLCPLSLGVEPPVPVAPEGLNRRAFLKPLEDLIDRVRKFRSLCSAWVVQEVGNTELTQIESGSMLSFEHTQSLETHSREALESFFTKLKMFLI